MKQIVSIKEAKKWLKYESQDEIDKLQTKVDELIEWGKCVTKDWKPLESPFEKLGKVKSKNHHRKVY